VKLELNQESQAQLAQDKHDQKFGSIHHPTEVTEPLGEQEGAESATQLKSDKTDSDQEAAWDFFTVYRATEVTECFEAGRGWVTSRSQVASNLEGHFHTSIGRLTNAFAVAFSVAARLNS